jgi:arylsulfatase A-like enzyme
MKKIIPILFLALGSVLFADEEKQPNIVIIICDDLNDSIEGMGGHPQAITPNINRLIQSGVRFTNAASNAPICGPSRASMWSGLHPISTGLYGGNQHKERWYQNAVLKTKKTLFEVFHGPRLLQLCYRKNSP